VISLSVVVYAVIAAAAFTALILLLKPFFKGFFHRLKLESEFLDFLSLLVTLEASGLRIDEVFLEASQNKLLLPSSYIELARKYAVLSKLSPDPYTCLRTLAKTIPSTKVARFLEGYSEVLISTNDTLTYVETHLHEEIRALQTRIDNYASILDTLFESYLIVLLSVVVYAAMPLIQLPPTVFSVLIATISLTALILAFKLSELSMYYNGWVFTVPTLLLAALTPIAVVVYPQTMYVHGALIIAIGVFLWLMFRGMLAMEREVELLLEDLYASARQGLPMDYAIIRVGGSYGFPVNRLLDLLKLGLKPTDILSSFNLPPLPKRVIGLILAPIEYTKGSPRYIGYVLNVVESVKSLRRVLRERGRVYFVYIIMLIVVVIALSRLIKSMGFNSAVGASDLVKGVLYASVFESAIVASTICTGYWFRNTVGYLLLLLSIICSSMFV